MTPVDRCKVLRDHAEGWLKAAQQPNISAELRAGYLNMAREFLDWARREQKQQS